MLAQEIERVGIPVAQVCALTLVAQSTGSSRVIQGVSVLHPVGDPALEKDQERALRRVVLERALEAVSRPAGGAGG